MKLLYGVIGIMLSGCSLVGARYDPGEYAALAAVAHTASVVKLECNDATQIKVRVSKINDAVGYLVLHTKHQQYNDEMYQISTELDKMSTELLNAASGNMSPAYCKIKIDAIIQATEIAMDASATKRR